MRQSMQGIARSCLEMLLRGKAGFPSLPWGVSKREPQRLAGPRFFNSEHIWLNQQNKYKSWCSHLPPTQNYLVVHAAFKSLTIIIVRVLINRSICTPSLSSEPPAILAPQRSSLPFDPSAACSPSYAIRHLQKSSSQMSALERALPLWRQTSCPTKASRASWRRCEAASYRHFSMSIPLVSASRLYSTLGASQRSQLIICW